MKYYKVGDTVYAITAANECLGVKIGENEIAQRFVQSEEFAEGVRKTGTEILMNDFIEIAQSVSDNMEKRAMRFAQLMFLD